jgi:hypothetical protein
VIVEGFACEGGGGGGVGGGGSVSEGGTFSIGKSRDRIEIGGKKRKDKYSTDVDGEGVEE